jgi:hypothetical protein
MLCLGDSIATYQGLGGVLHCSEIRAIKGKPSSFIIEEARKSGNNEICIVSAGSNDPFNIALEKNLKSIRSNLKCKIIVWVQPANNRAGSIVKKVALEYGDKTVKVIPGKDHVHPFSYSDLARDIKSKL